MSTAIVSRDLRIDFLRGLALIFIFWDHIPGNWVGQMTLRSVGFSDAAEVFVFLAGYAAALAYQKRMVQRGYFATALHLLRRAWILYIAHIFLLAQLIALIFLVNDLVPSRNFVEESGLTYFVAQPAQALVDGLLLRFKPSLLDPLPLYIVLLVALAGLLPAVIRHPRWVFALSGTLYAAAVMKQWNFTSHPQGVWFFNPLAWQFLFFLGALCGVHRATLAGLVNRCSERTRWQIIAVLLVFLALTAAVALSWRWPQWHDRWMPLPIAKLLYPISKTNLAPMRLLHFLALAFCVGSFMPQGSWLQNRLAQAVRLMGRHSLVVFCCGVLLAPLADCIDMLASDGILIQTFTSISGVVFLWFAAVVPEWFNRQSTAAISAFQNTSSGAPHASRMESTNALVHSSDRGKQRGE
jgi:hypothetical protein